MHYLSKGEKEVLTATCISKSTVFCFIKNLEEVVSSVPRMSESPETRSLADENRSQEEEEEEEEEEDEDEEVNNEPGEDASGVSLKSESQGRSVLIEDSSSQEEEDDDDKDNDDEEDEDEEVLEQNREEEIMIEKEKNLDNADSSDDSDSEIFEDAPQEPRGKQIILSCFFFFDKKNIGRQIHCFNFNFLL